MDIEVGARPEVESKVARVRQYLASSGLAGLLVTRQDNFAWLTGGKDNHVSQGAETGVGSLLVTHDARVALTNRIEAGRLRDEEIGEQGWDWKTFEWYRPGQLEAAVREVVGEGQIAADTSFPNARPLDRAFDELRADLTPEELRRYHEVGRICTEAIQHTCQTIHT